MASSRLIDLLRRLPVTVALTIAVCAVFAAQKAMGADSIAVLVRMGAMVPERLIEHGETWRLITAMFLHGGWVHFGLNLFALVQLAALTELLFGSRRLLAFYLVTGLAAGLTSTLFGPAHLWPAVGASGALFGLVGVLVGVALYGAPHWREQLQRPLRALMWAISLNFSILLVDLFVGLPVNIDHFAHLGGLVCGLLLAGAYPEPMAPVRSGESALAYGAIGAFLGAFVAAGAWGTDALEELPQDMEVAMVQRVGEREDGWARAGLLMLACEQLEEVGHPDVERVFEELIADSSIETLFWIEQSLHAENDWDRLVPLYEVWLELDPGNPQTKNALAWGLVVHTDESERDPERALELADAALAQLEELDEMWDVGAPWWAEEYLMDAQDLDAVKVGSRAAFLDTRAEALFQLGRLQEALTDQREAVDIGEEIEMGTLPEMKDRLDRIEQAIGS